MWVLNPFDRPWVRLEKVIRGIVPVIKARKNERVQVPTPVTIGREARNDVESRYKPHCHCRHEQHQRYPGQQIEHSAFHGVDSTAFTGTVPSMASVFAPRDPTPNLMTQEMQHYPRRDADKNEFEY